MFIITYRKASERDDEFKTSFLSLLSPLCSSSSSSLSELMKVLSVLDSLSSNMGMSAIKLIGDYFIDHPVKMIAEQGMKILKQVIITCQLSIDEVQDIMSTYPSIRTR